MSMDKWAASKSSTEVRVKLLLLLENGNFQALYLTVYLNTLQRPTHTLTPSSINRSKNWIYHGMH